MNQNGTENEGLTPKQLRVLEHLLREPTVDAAASAAKVGRGTIFRWLHEPAFSNAYREARRRVVEAAVGELQNACSSAVAALVRNLACKQPAVEVGAARIILDQAHKGVELGDLAERVEGLSAQLESFVSGQEAKKWH